jgi:hypothetical protein
MKIAPVWYFCYYTYQAPANDTITGIVRRGLMIFQSTKKDTQIEYQASFLLFGNSAQKKNGK